MIERRNLVAAVVAALAAGRATAQPAWPSRPVRIILPVPPDGAFDASVRLIQGPLARQLGQPVTVENRGGGAGIPAAEAVIRATDGHSFGLIGSSHAANATLMPSLPFDPVGDIAPVTLLARWPNVISVHPSTPWRSLAELLDAARARPGAISYGSPGIGLSQHLAGELLKIRARVDLPHVPYRGAGPALNDAVAGHVPAVVTALASTAPQVRAGRLRALAVTGPARAAMLPEVPTVAEQGFPGFEVVEWIGIMGPASTPPAVVQRLNAALVAAMQDEGVSRRLEEMGIESLAQPPEAFGAFLRSQVQVLGEVIRTAGIRAE
jgi:tripartite-type tricarboxylate transporter receptor subunit TctC